MIKPSIYHAFMMTAIFAVSGNVADAQPVVSHEIETSADLGHGRADYLTTVTDFADIQKQGLSALGNQPNGRHKILGVEDGFTAVSGRQGLKSLAAKAPTLSEWRTLEGDWKYKSLFMWKTYDTAVRVRDVTWDGDSEPTYQYVELTNDIFDHVVLGYDMISGRMSFRSTNDSVAVPPLVRGTHCGIVSSWTSPNREAYGSGQYLASGLIRMQNTYFSGEYSNDWVRHFYSCYDYLYDASATKAKISADFKRVNHGEPSVKVKLTKSDGVTDVYYAVILQPRDESKIEIEEEWSTDVKDYVWAYKKNNIATYVKDYADNGTQNPNLLLGKVDGGASEFDIPLQWTGVKAVAIVAFRDGELCDMVYDYIENRPEDGWAPVGNMKINLSGSWSDFDLGFPNVTLDCPENFRNTSDVMLEYREASKEYRLVNPLGIGGECDYIYIDATYGNKYAYIEQSYSPFTLPYEMVDEDGIKKSVDQPQMILSVSSFHLLRGFDEETLLKKYDLGLDISGGIFNIRNCLSLPMSAIEMCMTQSQLYINGGCEIQANVESPSFVIPVYDTNKFSLTFSTGGDIHHVDYQFIEAGNAENASEVYTYTPGDGPVSIIDLLQNNKISSEMTNVVYKGYDAAGSVIRSGDYELPRIEYKKYTAYVYFENNFDDEGSVNTSGERTVSKCSAGGGETILIIHDFFQNDEIMQLVDGSPDENLVVSFYGLGGSLNFRNYYLGKINFGNIGACDVTAWPYEESPYWEENTIIVPQYVWVATAADGNRYLWNSYRMEIRLSQDFVDSMSGVENVKVESIHGPKQYYNLQGMRIEHPRKGSLVIERSGNTSRKILF